MFVFAQKRELLSMLLPFQEGVSGASKIQLSSSFFPKGGSVAGIIDANMATFAGSFGPCSQGPWALLAHVSCLCLD